MSNKAKGKDKFVQVPLWWAEHAAKATRTPKAMVWVWLVYLTWEQRSMTFRLPNERLHIRGVSRFTKQRALRELEKAVGDPLFQPHGHGLLPTAAGRVFARHAVGLLQSLEQMGSELADLKLVTVEPIRRRHLHVGAHG